VTSDDRRVALRVELAADDARILRGALVAARATERAELERRAARHSFGYGTAGARASMDDDVARFRRRIELLDDLLAALDASSAGSDPPA
jgi:hypothetical protein